MVCIFSGNMEEVIRGEVGFNSLIRHLENSDEQILLSVLTLMNKLYLGAKEEEKRAIIKVYFL